MVVIMSRYTTVSTKVRKEVREEAEKLGIKVSEFLRNALEEELKKRKLALIKKRLEEAEEALNKLDIDRLVENIREDRAHG